MEIRFIAPEHKRERTVRVPGSKSLTQRAFVIASLAEGNSLIRNALLSEDTRLLMESLARFGADFSVSEEGVLVKGTGGKLKSTDRQIYLGNNGTALRFLLSIAALGKGVYRFTGDPRLQERPVGPLGEILVKMGARIEYHKKDGCIPLDVHPFRLQGGKFRLQDMESSQFVSSLMISGVFTGKGLEIVLEGKLLSLPYIHMTAEVMRAFGVDVEVRSNRIKVPGGQCYKAREWAVEGDATSASYFLALAPLCQKKIRVESISSNSVQGDIGFLRILENLGCEIQNGENWVEVKGGKMPTGQLEFDMGDMPDLVPTLAVIAAVRPGRTVIKNVPHLRIKESDRIAALARELSKMGVEVIERPDGMVINGGNPRGTEVETYNDHRIAMSFAVLGKVVKGVSIRNPRCVDKSFPSFWILLEG
ncbi:MAG: 3-phosphoshikimate 1-carboxyvinyltransferase [Syntrophales bacterium]|nr:3-phosphoshikimate 1-carboxyvinyltransferase [Syntrophales bacterium]